MHNRPFYTTGIHVRYLIILPASNKSNSQLRQQNSYQIFGHQNLSTLQWDNAIWYNVKDGCLHEKLIWEIIYISQIENCFTCFRSITCILVFTYGKWLAVVRMVFLLYCSCSSPCARPPGVNGVAYTNLSVGEMMQFTLQFQDTDNLTNKSSLPHCTWWGKKLQWYWNTLWYMSVNRHSQIY
jgi:hypothetical protein